MNFKKIEAIINFKEEIKSIIDENFYLSDEYNNRFKREGKLNKILEAVLEEMKEYISLVLVEKIKRYYLSVEENGYIEKREFFKIINIVEKTIKKELSIKSRYFIENILLRIKRLEKKDINIVYNIIKYITERIEELEKYKGIEKEKYLKIVVKYMIKKFYQVNHEIITKSISKILMKKIKIIDKKI